MEATISWITGHLPQIFGVLLATHVVAIAIVNLTPTPTDDQIVAKVYTWIEWAAGLLTPKAKDTGTKNTDPTSNGNAG